MNYKTPGVYVEEQTKFPPSVAQVETAVPAFVGYTARGPKNTPTRISSMLDYESLFGEANPETFAVAFKDGVATVVQPKVSDFKMYYAMQMYFANGGGACYIVSVGRYNDEVTVGNSTTAGTLLYGLELLKKEDEPTLIVFPDLQDLVATSADVAIAHTQNTSAQNAVTIANAAVVVAEDAIEDAMTPQELELAEQVLADAEADAAIAAEVFDLATKNLNKAITANSDDSISNVYQVYNEALKQAESLKDRFVIMDVLGDELIFRDEVFATGLNYGAAYYPKLKTILTYDFNDAEVSVTGFSDVTTLEELKLKSSEFYNQAKKAIESKKVVLAPSSAMAGVYARVDSTSGVWKSPANLGLSFVEAPTVKISEKEQENLNVHAATGKSINVIRAFTGKGNLVWGARTLDGNSNEWRYISVRRFFSMVEESVKKATERFIFEPNNANTWIRVQTMIENFLNQQWQDGALAGSKPEDAYYVNVGLGKTMSETDIIEGRMVVVIGMAAVRPAEFIVLRFSHKLQEA